MLINDTKLNPKLHKNSQPYCTSKTTKKLAKQQSRKKKPGPKKYPFVHLLHNYLLFMITSTFLASPPRKKIPRYDIITIFFYAGWISIRVIITVTMTTIFCATCWSAVRYSVKYRAVRCFKHEISVDVPGTWVNGEKNGDFW